MKLTNIVLLFSFIILSVACSSHSLPFSTEHENTWFLHKGSLGSTYPMYCKANKTDVGAKPVCYEADIK